MPYFFIGTIWEILFGNITASEKDYVKSLKIYVYDDDDLCSFVLVYITCFLYIFFSAVKVETF